MEFYLSLVRLRQMFVGCPIAQTPFLALGRPSLDEVEITSHHVEGASVQRSSNCGHIDVVVYECGRKAC